MIIFDTNAVNLLPTDGPRADILRKLRGSGHHRVVVPWMVLEEMAAHQAFFYPARYQSVEAVLHKLQEVLPWKVQSNLEPLDVERLLEHWRQLYREIFEVIETSGEAAQKALQREAMALPPAKRVQRGKDEFSIGSRDAAIWFSVLEYLRANPDEHVYFVTNNSSDFGDGSHYPYPMNEDVAGMEDRLTRLTDFDDVVAEFTKEVSGAEAEAAADRLLRSIAIRSQVAQTAVEVLDAATGFVGLGGTDSAVRWRAWVAAPETELLGLSGVTGHEIEGEIWYTAKARWLLYGAVDGDSDDAEYIACVWETKILFSAGEEDQTPTLLTQDQPSLPDTGDQQCMEVLRRLKATTAEAAQRALDALTTRSSGAAAYIAQQMAAKPTATIAQIAGAKHVNTLMEQVAATNLKLGSAQSLFGPLPKSIDISSIGIGKTAAEQVFGSMPKSTLDIASIMPSVKLAQSAIGSLPKSVIADLGIGKTAAEQVFGSMPKSTLDIASIMPSVKLAQSAIGSLPKSVIADLGIGKTAVEQAFGTMAKDKLAGYSFPSEAKQAESQDEQEPDDGAEEADQPEDHN
ncbi:PIN domain-containing protein [Actinacidiphila sp. ITFR-21]|uniref:PIN domain-containing protein n=1 Tax=Actinacidiphila sp. ITFR-21 TaxID=3075199 RepID=UPI00288BA4A9|nr:PIN domain-containing protein [Streptomyces sp. ITFR-21]WNI20220.1 PIN domain-containing protein [Streptomyces sp. ITFR-21]